MTPRMRAIALMLAAALPPALAGCAAAPAVSHYVLSAAEPPAAVPDPGATRVSLAPVTIPDRVDRPELVVRSEPNRIEILDDHRWGEPLRESVPRVLGADLARHLGNRFAVAVGGRPGAAGVQVAADIRTFDATPSGEVTVEADWTVRRDGGGARTGQSRILERAATAGHAGVAAAYSRALDRLAAEIAAVVRP